MDPVVDLASSLFDWPADGATAEPAGRLTARIAHVSPGNLEMPGIVGDDALGSVQATASS